MKTAILTGTSGQTGSYLTEILLNEGYKVYGLKRRSSSLNTQRVDHLFSNPNLKLVYGDLSDYSSILSFVGDVKPDLFFNLGAMSMVRVSFDISEYTMDVTGTGALRCLEAIRKASPKTRFLQASSSEQFGSSPPPQNENTTFKPQSPYAVAKLAAYNSTILYREAYNLFACNSICFNHESSRRGPTFVTKKITAAATKIKLGLQDKLYLGNLLAVRDWGFARDYAEAMLTIITSDNADDYVVATGKMHTVEDFVKIVFEKLGMDYKNFVEFDARLLRPREVEALCGDASKIRNKLGWEPKYDLDMIIDEMLAVDMKLAEQELLIRNSDK